MRINLTTESLARGASRRPWLTIGAWMVGLVVAVVLIGTLLGDALTTDDSAKNNPESDQAYELLDQRLQSSGGGIDELVVVRSDNLTVDDADYRYFVEGLYLDLTRLGEDVVLGGTYYYLHGDESVVSADRRTTYFPIKMAGDSEEQVAQVNGIIDEAGENAFYQVYIAGVATMEAELIEIAEKDLQTGEGIGITVALIVLALVFGAVAAALLPIVLAIAAVIVALGVTAIVGQAFELSFFVTNIITMMGLAVGIDYSLFIVSRYREERGRGLDKHEAIAAAGATASRAILFSGLTVMLALCGMLIFPLSTFQTIGAGAILVVIAAVLASLTLLPAVLGLLGDKINAVRIPLVQRGHKAGAGESDGGFWAMTARSVMRRPVLSLVIAVGLLGAAIVPFFNMESGFSGVSDLPDGLRSKDAFLVLQEEFGFGQDSPAMIVVDGETDSPQVQATVKSIEAAVASDAAFVPAGLAEHPEANLTVIYARLAGDPSSQGAMDAVDRLRNEYIPDALDGASTRVLVTGETAEIVDFTDTTNTYTPIIFAFVLGLSFVLLMVAFRSIVVPVTSIIMNLLSVGAAYGMVVLVFQKGIGADLLGFQKVEAIETWLPLFLFSILFGLSMDYHVFLLSRIRERFMQTGDNEEAVAFGLRSTGRLITGAALIMVAVFGGFALGDLAPMQQMGFGLAVAVFMDATIVRSVLVPSTMRLLGNWNWYMPAWLEWLPKVAVGEGSVEEPEPVITVPVPQPVVGQPALCPVPVPVHYSTDIREQ